MTSIAYLYSDPLLGPPPPVAHWPQAVAHLYEDFALERPQLRSLLATLQSTPPPQRPNCLMVTGLDALAENLAELTARLHQIDALGVTVVTVEPAQDGGQTAAPTALGELLAVTQQRQQRRRLQRGHARNRLQALPPPGKAPYGYRRTPKKYELDKAAVPVVKAFFEQFMLYGSLRGAVRYIDRRYGKKISPSTGKRWLTSPVYRGHTAYKDGGIVPETHAPILSPDGAAQVDRLLRRNRGLPPRTASAPRSLSGLVTCQTCGSGMKVSQVSAPRRAHTYLYLQPTSCPNQPRCRALRYETVLQRTIDTICTELPQVVAQLPAGSEDRKVAITQTLTDKQQIIDQLPALVSSGVLDETTAKLRRYTLQNEIAIAQQTLAQLPPVNLQELFRTVTLPQFWQDLSESERRFFFREFIRGIHIHRNTEPWLTLDFVF
ncbi:MAG: recombinase family protein [Cyanobacteria bacterium P01_A01_bin.105]